MRPRTYDQLGEVTADVNTKAGYYLDSACQKQVATSTGVVPSKSRPT